MRRFQTAISVAVLGAAVASIALPAAASDTATATGSASATVVVPISLTKIADLNFGVITPNGTAGIVTVATNGARTGASDVLVGGGSPAAASFRVEGDADRAFTFTLPSSAATLSSGVHSMSVDTWTSNAPATLLAGSVNVNVGGTLNVAAAQPAGAYVGTFAVTATYN